MMYVEQAKELSKSRIAVHIEKIYEEAKDHSLY